MLFIPPLPPIQLRAEGKLLVGRSGRCDLRLPDVDTSRRHAEIVATDDGFVVRDLASTNGTFVNGERIAEYRLRPGDRIQIGSNTVTFCQVGGVGAVPGGDAGERGEEKTMLVERPALTEVFQGDLAEIPPFAVLQILEMGRKTGALMVESEGSSGRLWFLGGEPVHAETRDQAGFDAALAVVNVHSGRFTFEPQAAAPEKTIQASVTQLLLEASRQLDEESS